MKKITFLVLLLFILCAAQAVGQDKPAAKSEKLTSQDRELLATANGFYKDNNFIRALAIYKVLAESYPDNAEIVYKTGVCYLYKSDEKEKAIDFMKSAWALNHKLDDINFNLGRAYHINYKFAEAVGYFEAYLKENPPVLKKNMTEHYIQFCKDGEVIVMSQSNIIIENIGPPVNTENSEYVPVVSADESVLIFTYKGERSTGGLMDPKFNPAPDGEYTEDVFISYKLGEKWTDPVSIGENINTKGNDASIALSVDGQKLFIFKSTAQDKGDIYMSQLKGEVWGKPQHLGPNINTPYWEGSCSMSADEQTLYIASERPGGLGGRDIYVSKKQSDGEWGPAKNLGPKINTKFDDDAPFIHPDGITLFFSSKGHNSMGGYDIFYSVYKNAEWGEPVNMGAPINTTDDDIYYVLTPDGETGYYSSNRKEGYGQQDIYVISPGLLGDKPILALAVGQVLLDSKPVEASIKVSVVESGAMKGNYRSNSATGKYMVALPPGDNYKLAIEVEGRQPHYEYVNVKTLDTYVQLQQDIQIYSEEYMKENKIDSMGSDNLQKSLDMQLKKYKEESNPDVYEARMYSDLLKKYGEAKKDSVTYNVDLGTYETASDLDSAKFASMGAITSVKNANGSTTYSVGGFKTMLDAELFRQKVITQDKETGAVSQVTVNDKGTTKLVPQYYASLYTRKDYTVRTEPKLIKTKDNQEAAQNNLTAKLVSEYGDKEIDGLSYKLEIGAVDKASDFKLQKLSKYGKIESKKYPDGKIHYTIGRFKTLKESDDFKKMLVQKEKEASKSIITVFYLSTDRSLKDFFNDPSVQDKLNGKKPAEVASESACDTLKIHNFASLVGKSLNDPAVYSQLMSIGGSMCVDGLTFKVQVGAYRHPENYKYGNLKPTGKNVERNDALGDGITRFTIGEFKNLKDTEALRQTALRLGTKDAWITAVYNGKRMTLEELIPLNFYNKGVN